jgi:hypothetical protein
MCTEFSDQPGEHNAGTIVEVAQWYVRMMSLITSRGDTKTSTLTTFISGITSLFAILALEAAMLCPLANSELWNATRHDSEKENQPFCQKNNTNEISSC